MKENSPISLVFNSCPVIQQLTLVIEITCADCFILSIKHSVDISSESIFVSEWTKHAS